MNFVFEMKESLPHENYIDTKFLNIWIKHNIALMFYYSQMDFIQLVDKWDHI